MVVLAVLSEVGDRESIERIRKNPLYRVLRADKMTYAALEATLQAYLQRQEQTIPTIAMLRLSADELRARCEALAQALTPPIPSPHVVAVESVIGGGTTPRAVLPGFAVAVRHATLSEEQFAAALRTAETPVVVRIHKGSVLLDLRTIPREDDALLQRIVAAALLSKEPATATDLHST